MNYLTAANYCVTDTANLLTQTHVCTCNLTIPQLSVQPQRCRSQQVSRLAAPVIRYLRVTIMRERSGSRGRGTPEMCFAIDQLPTMLTDRFPNCRVPYSKASTFQPCLCFSLFYPLNMPRLFTSGLLCQLVLDATGQKNTLSLILLCRSQYKDCLESCKDSKESQLTAACETWIY